MAQASLKDCQLDLYAYEMLVLGMPVPSVDAIEMIRRTDLVFAIPRSRDESEYSHSIKQALGMPTFDSDGPELLFEWVQRVQPSLEVWRQKWGSLDIQWPRGSYLLSGDIWVSPDGAINGYSRCEDHKREDVSLSVSEALNDARVLAATFPNLEVTLAIWTNWNIADVFEKADATDAQFQALVHGNNPPDLGIVIRNGKAELLAGADPALFSHLGLDAGQFVRRVLEKKTSLQAAAAPSVFGKRRPGNIMPDEAVFRWIDLARSLKLVG